MRKKRVALHRESDFTKRFKKDWERLGNSGRYDLRSLKELMTLLICNDAPLPPEYLGHPLKGDWQDFRECHIGGDFLLVYRVEGNVVIFAAAGTHTDLFE